MNKQVTTLYIVRHGESEANIKNIVGGQQDHPLTQRGEKQARKLAIELKHIHFDEILSSDLIRAKRTAEIIALERKLAVKTNQAIREQHYGDWEGKNEKELLLLFHTWRELTHHQRLKLRVSPGAESAEEVIGRFITFLREAAVAYKGKTIMVVCHGGLMVTFLSHVGSLDYKDLRRIDNTAYIKVESDGIDFFVKEMRGIHMIGERQQ